MKSSVSDTKKITEGGLLLSISALSLIVDRTLGFILEDILLLLIPIVSFIYSSRHGLKSFIPFYISVILLGFMLGNITTYVYLPVFALLGLVFTVRRNDSLLWLESCLLFIVSEIVITFLIAPIFGFETIFQNVWTMASYSSGVAYIGFAEGLLLYLIVVILSSRLKLQRFERPNFAVGNKKYLFMIGVLLLCVAYLFKQTMVILSLFVMAGTVLICLFCTGYLFDSALAKAIKKTE